MPLGPEFDDPLTIMLSDSSARGSSGGRDRCGNHGASFRGGCGALGGGDRRCGRNHGGARAAATTGAWARAGDAGGDGAALDVDARPEVVLRDGAGTAVGETKDTHVEVGGVGAGAGGLVGNDLG
jgi:hypothetical protein